MTHDFKTPILTISIANEFLSRIDLPDNQGKIKRYTSIIQEETNRLKSMVEHILQYSLLEEGKLSVVLEKCNINSIIEEVVNSYELIVKNKNGNIAFTFEYPVFEINVDKAHLYNAISNLIDNAIKYSLASPSILIESSKHGNYIQIKVTDNGIGINPFEFNNIFKKRYRIHTINSKGFGIGLYYVKAIVDAHHGSINVISSPKKGSSFIINLPSNNN